MIIFQSFLDAEVGDMVIGYETNPVKKVVALARITQVNHGKDITFEKMEFFVQPNGSLFRLTKGEYDFIMDIIREENPLKQPDAVNQRYTREDFLDKVYMTKERYDVLEGLLRYKMNVILQGAPGVGKTFIAKKLAYAMMGAVDDSRIEMIQFRQNYSYEKFILEYYHLHHTYLSEAKAGQVKWNLEGENSESMLRFLPIMQTDIMLRWKEKLLIIDAKYYGQTLQKQFDKYTLHSNNLYQIFTYVKNQDKDHTGNVVGLLLYAKTDEDLAPDCMFNMGGNQIGAKTLDLNQDFSLIAAQLDKIVEDFFQMKSIQ